MSAIHVLQLLELLTTFVDKPQFRGQVQAALKEMMYVTITYLQMTQVITTTAPTYSYACQCYDHVFDTRPYGGRRYRQPLPHPAWHSSAVRTCIGWLLHLLLEPALLAHVEKPLAWLRPSP